MAKLEFGAESSDLIAVLRNRNFMLLWLAQMLSQVGQNAIIFALVILIEIRTGSSTQMGLFVVTALLPSVFLGLGAGVLVDRTSKKAVMATTNFLRAVVILGFLFFDRSLALIYLATFVFSGIGQFFAPAEAASIPQVVPRRQLLSANGLFNFTFHGAQLVGFVLVAPTLINLIGFGPFFVALSSTFFIAGILVSFLPSLEHERASLPISPSSTVKGILQELIEGWQLLLREARVAFSLVHLTLASSLTLIVGMLAPGYVSRVLGIRAEDAAIVVAPAGIGIIFGIISVPRLASHVDKEHLAHVGLIAMGVCLTVLGLVPGVLRRLAPFVGTDIGSSGLLPTIMMAAFLLGLAYALVTVPSQTIVQERVPIDLRGRIFATLFVVTSGVALLPILFLGSLADLIGITMVAAVLGLIVIGFGILSLFGIGRSSYADSGPTASEA